MGAQLSLSVNDRRWLGQPTARRPREEDIMSMPNLVGYGSITFDSAWVELMNINRASIWRVLVLATVKILKNPGQH
jgi:hypothetical protein